MVFYAAIALVLAVLGGGLFVVGSDLFRRPAGERLDGLKEWQSLIGAVLGFMGAAGVLVLGTAIETEQGRQRGREREHAIGQALAYEAERLSNGLAAGIGIVNLIKSQPPGQDFIRTCTKLVETLRVTLDKEKPVWRAALGQMVEFGDENLQLFVRYHGLYDDIVHDVKQFDLTYCQLDPETQITQFGRRMEFAFGYYREITAAYGTALVEPRPVDPVQTPVTGIEPPASASETEPGLSPPATVEN